MKNLQEKFWKWYEKHTVLNTGIASLLFTLQLVHLYWLTTDVVIVKLAEKSLFNHGLRTGLFSIFILIVDYVEIPAIITTSILYLNELRKKFNVRSLWFLFFINSQWLHMFWITDEFVLEHFFEHKGGTILPVWLAWVAILIDYLELPVIFDTIKKFFASLKKERLLETLHVHKKE
jgi:hypothetical protein